MNKRVLNISLFLLLASTGNVLAQQGIGTNTPHRSAALHVDSQNKGLLIPRMNLTHSQTNGITAPITYPAQGLLVYNNQSYPVNATGQDVLVPEGFYYFDGTNWNPISKSYLENSSYTTILGTGTSSDPYKINLVHASSTEYGVVKIGGNISVTDGVISVNFPPNTIDTNTTTTVSTTQSYITVESSHTVGDPTSPLQTVNYEIGVDPATETSLGVVAPGEGLAIADGILSVDISTIENKGNLTSTEGDDSITVTNGTGATLVNTNIKVSDLGITTGKLAEGAVTPAKVEAGTNNTVLSTDESGNVVWVDKSTLDTDTTYSGSTSVYLNGTSFEREALTGDVTSDRNSNVLTIAEGAVTSIKIADGTIETIDLKDSAVTPAKVKAGTNNTVLSTDESGNVVWVDKSTLDTDTTYSGSTSVYLNGTSFEREALTGDVTSDRNSNALTIAEGAVTSIKIADGTIETIDLKDSAVTPAKVEAGTNNTVLSTDESGNVVWVDKSTLDTDTTYSGSTSVYLNGTSFEREALTGDVTSDRNSNVLTIAEGAVTSIKIADGTIETIDLKDSAVTPAKVEAGANNTVLSTDESGNVVWVDKSTLDTDTTYSGSTSVYLNGTSFEREALTGDVTSDRNSNALTIAEGAVTSIKIADGTIETIDLKDSAVTPAKVEAGTNNTVLSTDESGNVVWVDKSTLDTDTTYSGSTSVYLNGTSFEREALTGDVTSDRNSNVLTIAEGAVTSIKIADGTIETIDLKDSAVTPAKIEAGTNNTVLSTDESGNVVWVNKSTLDTDTTYSGSTSVYLNGTSFEREALTGDVTSDRNSNALTIAEGAVTSIKIADGTIETIDIKDSAVTPAKVEAGTNNTVLSTDESGNVVWVDKSTLDTDTTYSAGLGISLDGTQFSVPVTTTGNGNVLTGVTATATGLEFTKEPFAATDTRTKVEAIANRPITVTSNAFTVGEENTYTLDLKVGSGLEVESDGTLKVSFNDTDNQTLTFDSTSKKLSIVRGNEVDLSVIDTDNQQISYDESTKTLSLQRGGNPIDLSTLAIDTKTKVQAGDNVTVTPTTDPTDELLNTYTVNVATAAAQEETTAGTLGVVKPSNQFEIASDGHLKIKYATPEFFYMPALLIPLSGQTNAEGFLSLDLHGEYQLRFSTPAVVSANPELANLSSLVVPIDMLDIYITYFDEQVLEDVSIDTDGKMWYKVKANYNYTEASFMNVVFKVRNQPKQ